MLLKQNQFIYSILVALELAPPQLPSGKERGLELGGKMEKNNGGCANKAVGFGGESCCGCHFSFGLVRLHTQQHMLTISSDLFIFSTVIWTLNMYHSRRIGKADGRY